ncbi:MAG: tRNA (N(6)-L-threonylcarbamoyladenosine(37)-C(2))-methylthiotransferase MtaB [Treponema sp.]|nr:MAG: tRNA (N(6)-L-threonylcarbamoyladenosine(37)-C(2))-methylthiotransferase MtaB [Treponema sp.]
MMNNIILKTIGCRLNQTETEAMASAFKDAGFSVSNHAKTDNVCLVFFNTCTVTSKAEQKARRLIRNSLKEFPKSVVIVTGCYAELAAGEIEAIDKRIICFSGKNKDILVNLPAEIREIQNYENTDENIKQLISLIKQFKNKTEKTKNMKFKLATDKFFFHSRAGLKIQDGCNNACTFCRVHIARGKSISLPFNTVIERAKKIEANGIKEIVLTGVNLFQYQSESINFAKLLKMLLDSTENIGFRISSIYPETITDEFLEVIKSKRIRPHFHLSIQSGSPRILKLMHRPHDIKQIEKSIQKLQKAKDLPFLGCDIITGFPTETQEDFQLTLRFCKKNHFTGIHAFSFSPRPDTPACLITPKVPERIAGNRVKELNSLARKQYNEYLEKYNGRIVSGIIETKRKTAQTKILTENYLLLPLKTPEKTDYKQGEEIKIKITNGYAIPEL